MHILEMAGVAWDGGGVTSSWLKSEGVMKLISPPKPPCSWRFNANSRFAAFGTFDSRSLRHFDAD